MFIFSATPTAVIVPHSPLAINTEFYGSINIEVSKFTTVDGWFKDGVQIDFASAQGITLRQDDALEFRRAQKSDAGRYHFTATNELGTAVSDEIEVTVTSKWTLVSSLSFSTWWRKKNVSRL